MRGWKLLVAAALALDTVLAVAPAMAGSDGPLKLDGTAWILAVLPGHTLLADRPVTMRMDNGRVYGTDGCNRYSAPYSATSDGFQLSAAIASTKMACPEPEMTQGDVFLSALTNARGARTSGTQLVLVDADGKELATFEVQREELANTAWQVTAYNNGSEAVINVLPDTSVTLEFGADGKVKGSGGCNEYSATFASSGQNLTLTDATATRKTCAPENLMLQERLYFKALAMVALARIDGNRLELRGRDGALVVAATRKAATSS